MTLAFIALMMLAQVEEKPVAHLLGKPIGRDDCLSRTLGIGSPAVGLESLVEAAMMEHLGKSEKIALTPVDVRAYIARAAEARKRLPNPPADSPFDVKRAEGKLAAIREKLAREGLPLLERRALEEQEKARAASIEYGSEDAAMAVALLPRLRFYEAVQRKYGGRVYAAGLGLVPAEALERLRLEMEASGKIVIVDGRLRAELRERADAVRKPEAVSTATEASFRWPFFLEF